MSEKYYIGLKEHPFTVLASKTSEQIFTLLRQLQLLQGNN